MANKLPEENLEGSNKKPPIDPLLACILTAFMSPSILADDAVIAPLLDTLNKLEDINTSLATVDADIAKRLPADNLVGSSKKPPIDPLVACILTAFISPPILADDAVIAPLLVTLNSLEDINNSFATNDADIANRLPALSFVVSSSNPPIDPLPA